MCQATRRNSAVNLPHDCCRVPRYFGGGYDIRDRAWGGGAGARSCSLEAATEFGKMAVLASEKITRGREGRSRSVQGALVASGRLRSSNNNWNLKLEEGGGDCPNRRRERLESRAAVGKMGEQRGGLGFRCTDAGF